MRTAFLTALCLSCAIRASADEPARDPKLADLIKKVKEQEARYADSELLITDEYTHLRLGDLPPEILPDIIEKSTTVRRIIRQGNLRYISRLSKGVRADGKKSEGQSVQAYDGTKTRARWGKQRQVHDGLKPLSFTVCPHMLLFDRTWPGEMSLAEFLGQTQTKDGEWAIVVVVEGSEEIGGLECVKAKIEYSNLAGGATGSRICLWLASKRNYFPVKSIYEASENSKGLGGENRVLKWNEIQPGVWVPKSIEIVVNGWDPNAGLIVPDNRTELRVDEIDLKPRFPQEFFQDVELPGGK